MFCLFLSQRRRDYTAHLRDMGVRLAYLVDQPDFAFNDGARKKEEDTRWRLSNAWRVRAVQKQQAEDRRNRG
jgi:hypothetical protein